MPDLKADIDDLMAIEDELLEESDLRQALNKLADDIKEFSNSNDLSASQATGAVKDLRVSLETLLGLSDLMSKRRPR